MWYVYNSKFMMPVGSYSAALYVKENMKGLVFIGRFKSRRAAELFWEEKYVKG